jgi:hypothetical protein
MGERGGRQGLLRGRGRRRRALGRAHPLEIEPEVHEDNSGVKVLLDHIGFHEARYALNSDTTVTVDLSPPRRGCS